MAARSTDWCAAARLLRLWVRIPTEACMFVSCECCVLSSRGLCVGPITLPEESYRLWCVCDRESSIMRRPWPTWVCFATVKKNYKITTFPLINRPNTTQNGGAVFHAKGSSHTDYTMLQILLWITKFLFTFKYNFVKSAFESNSTSFSGTVIYLHKISDETAR